MHEVIRFFLDRPRLNYVLFLFLFLGGVYSYSLMPKEIFPPMALSKIGISGAYPGASPEEVERGIVLAVEEAVQGLEGIKEMSASAQEGVGRVTVEILEGENIQRLAQDIKNEVDRISSFPVEAEEPKVVIAQRKRYVISLALYGDQSQWVLRDVAEDIRDRLIQDPDITQVELEGIRNYEISIEISQSTLRAYNLTLEEVAQRIRRASVELPGGAIKAPSGDVLLRMKELELEALRAEYNLRLALADIERQRNLAKRLEQGTFHWPRSAGEPARISIGIFSCSYS